MKKIWIDIDNTPHVLFFKPIIEELKMQQFDVIITARNYGGINQLLSDANIDFYSIGGDYGKNKIAKIFGSLKRILNLYFYVRDKKIDASASHGSRTHIGASWLARIPSLTSYDYEYSSKFLINKLASKIIIPKSIFKNYLLKNSFNPAKFTYYDGFKEQVYLEEFIPSLKNIPEDYVKQKDSVIILIRPPAMRSHYVTTKTKETFLVLIEFLKRQKNIFVVLSPRDEHQKNELVYLLKDFVNSLILQKEYDGLSLIWFSDLVISGGGTMNREAALLGVPVYSIFGGDIGSVDKELEKLGRLTFVSSESKIKDIVLKKRDITLNGILKKNIKTKIIKEITKLCTKY